MKRGRQISYNGRYEREAQAHQCNVFPTNLHLMPVVWFLGLTLELTRRRPETVGDNWPDPGGRVE